MAVVFMDGFETYPTGTTGLQAAIRRLWPGSVLNSSSSIELGVGGGSSLRMNSSSDFLWKNDLNVVTTTYTLGFAFKLPNTYKGNGGGIPTHVLCRVEDTTSNNILCAVMIQNSTLTVTRSTSTATTLLRTRRALRPHRWYYVELEVDIQTTPVGSVTLWVDGINEGTASTVQTAAAYSGAIGEIVFDEAQAGIFYDDFYLSDDNGSPLGPIMIKALQPDGDVATGTWATTGANYFGEVNENSPSNDVTLVNSATVGDQLIMSHGNTSVTDTVTNIKAVQVNSMADTTAADNLQHIFAPGGVPFVQAAQAAPGTFTTLYNVLNNNPATAVAWTQADLDALQTGVQP